MSNLLIFNFLEWTSKRYRNPAFDVELLKGNYFLSSKNADFLSLWCRNNWTLPIGPIKISGNKET